MPHPIRVLLDVTQFGVVQEFIHDPMHRAGMHRVVQQTVRSLDASPDVVLSLCAREKTELALTFLDGHQDLHAVPFRPARHRIGRALRRRAVDAHARAGGHPARALPKRLASKLAAVGNEYLDARGGPLGPAKLLRADVYHSPVYALPPAYERAPRLRYVLTVYDVIPFLFPEFASWGGEAWLRRIVDSIGPDDHVVTISEQSKQDLLKTCPHVSPERVHVTYLAADPERFYRCDDAERLAAVRARYHVPDAPYVLSVGTLEPRKNMPHLIRAFAELVRAERLDDLHLVLTGSKGWDFEAIFAAAGDLQDLRERIVVTGYVDDADLAPLYSGALVFAYPSFYEGFGLPPLEAMQCGTPVITGNTSSLPEVVGDAGVMVDPRNGDALAQAILDVYQSDAGTRAELSRRALARARQFTWARYAEQTVAAYRAAL